MNDIIRKLLLTCLTAVIFLSSAVAKISTTIRIVNGQVTNAFRVPYIVRIQLVDGSVWCDGTLVTLQHVVTAAHCFDNLDPIKDLLVLSGVSTLDEKGQVRTVANYYKAADYSSNTFNMDFGVIKVSEPFELGPKTLPINLCSKPPQPGKKVKISGFGRTKGGGQPSYLLREVIMPIISKEKCSETFPLTDSMLCVQRPHRGPCQADSGGPLVADGELCGIVSWGLKTCDYSNGAPAVFTNVTAVLPYIEDAILNL